MFLADDCACACVEATTSKRLKPANVLLRSRSITIAPSQSIFYFCAPQQTETPDYATARPEIDRAGAAFAVQVILSDQSLLGETAIDRRGRGAAFNGLFLGALGQIELNDDDAVGHERFPRICFSHDSTPGNPDTRISG